MTYLENTIKQSFIETSIYNYSPLTCIYYLNIYDRRCEVEVRSLPNLENQIITTQYLKYWEPDLVFSYVFNDEVKKDINFSLITEWFKENKHIPARIIRKQDLLYESILLSNNHLTEVRQKHWYYKHYGYISRNNNSSLYLEVSLTPKMSNIEFFKFINTNN